MNKYIVCVVAALAFARVGLAESELCEEHACGDHACGEHAPLLPVEICPSISLIVDTMFYNEDSAEGMSHLKEEVSGFGHGHHDGDHEHSYEDGFNLRHVEVQFSATIDDYLKASAIAAFSQDEFELETAEVETTSLPWGLTAKVGKFFSSLSYHNEQHSHEWSFADQPLVYEMMLGTHGLNEKGAQLAWLAPIPGNVRLGVEALQGENENMFAVGDADESGLELEEHSGLRLGVLWLRAEPYATEKSTVQTSLFAARGRHQEVHEEGSDFNALDGYSTLWGAELIYAYRAGGDHNQGDLFFQAEYLAREKDLDLESSTDAAAAIGDSMVSEQDGYCLQATYGFLPRWSAGLRWEQIGLTNEFQEPGEAAESYGSSYRASAMVDYAPSDASRVRLQLNNGEYETDEGAEDVWEFFAQLTVAFGEHEGCLRGCNH